MPIGSVIVADCTTADPPPETRDLSERGSRGIITLPPIRCGRGVDATVCGCVGGSSAMAS